MSFLNLSLYQVQSRVIKTKIKRLERNATNMTQVYEMLVGLHQEKLREHLETVHYKLWLYLNRS
jgi:hypothetical protein